MGLLHLRQEILEFLTVQAVGEAGRTYRFIQMVQSTVRTPQTAAQGHRAGEWTRLSGKEAMLNRRGTGA